MKKRTNSTKIFQKFIDRCENFFLRLFSKIGLKTFVKYYEKHVEAMRYLVFGGFSTLLNIVVFAIFDLFLPTLFSNLLAWLASVVFAYITNKYCVFNVQARTKAALARELITFFLSRLFTLVIDESFMYLTVSLWRLPPLPMKILDNLIVIILNFILSKLIVFKKRRPTPRPHNKN